MPLVSLIFKTALTNNFYVEIYFTTAHTNHIKSQNILWLYSLSVKLREKNTNKTYANNWSRGDWVRSCHFFLICNHFVNISVSWEKSKLNSNSNIWLRGITELLSLNTINFYLVLNFSFPSLSYFVITITKWFICI